MYKTIGKNVKYLRNKKNISQQELADKVEISRSAVAYWELGKSGMSLHTLYKLAKVLDVTIDMFFIENLEELEKKEKEKNELEFFNNMLKENNIIKKDANLNNKEYKKMIDFININSKYIIDNKKLNTTGDDTYEDRK